MVTEGLRAEMTKGRRAEKVLEERLKFETLLAELWTSPTGS